MKFYKESFNNNKGAGTGKVLLLGLLGLMTFSGCKKLYDLPEEKDYLSNNINYSSKVFEPVLGRTAIMGNFNPDNSTQPLTFEIVNPRYGNGKELTDLFQVQPVYVWTAEYNGLEKSLEEIEAKRKIENHPLFEVTESGEFIIWAAATDALVPPRATDSSDLVQDKRYFDLRVKNSGGEIILRDFQVRPWRERPYEPSTDLNLYTGGIAPDPTDPLNPRKRDYIRPSILDNVIGELSNTALVSNDARKDVVVFIRPFEGGNGHSLRFKFLDKNENPINPAMFNETRWDQIIHGFNRVTTPEYVQYDVAYPIPLTAKSTAYTNGSNAHVEFSYSRRAFGGGRTIGKFGLDFSIYRPGDWEIVFYFRTDNPKFEDE